MNAAKPFVCPAIGCNQQFANEDHLEVHRRKHEMSLGLRDFKSLDTPVIADQTPTPTRFLKNCEEVGLFSELPNPFDAVFRRANIDDDDEVNTDHGGRTSNNEEIETNGKDNEGASVIVESVESVATERTTIVGETTSTTTVTSPRPQDVSSTTHEETEETTVVAEAVVESVSVPVPIDATAAENEAKPIAIRKLSAADEQPLQPVQPQPVQPQQVVQQLPPQQPTIAIVSTAHAMRQMQAPQVTSINIPTLNSIPISAPILLRLPNGQTIPVVPPSVSNPAYNIPIAISAQPMAIAEPAPVAETAATVDQSNVKLKLKNALLTSQSQGNLGVMTQAVEVVTRQQAVTSTSAQIKPEAFIPAATLGKRRRSSSEDGYHPQDHKRVRFLERNRAAATRCRNKRKQWIQNLEEKASDLNSNNNKLQNEVTTLRNEVAQLKELLLAHKNCPVTLMQRKAATAQMSTGTATTTELQTNNHTHIVNAQQETLHVVTTQPETVRIINAQAETVSMVDSQPETVRIVNAQPETIRIVNLQPEVIEVVRTGKGQRAIAMNIEQNPAGVVTLQAMSAGAQGTAS